MFINVGAIDSSTGRRFKTKKALREALKDKPSEVRFDRTSIFDDQGDIDGNAIPAGAQLSVVGPDPYNDRRWYATVQGSDVGVRVS